MRLTRFGAVVIALLVVCGLLVFLASRPVSYIAATVGVIVLAALGVGASGFSGGWPGRTAELERKRELLREEARPRR